MSEEKHLSFGRNLFVALEDLGFKEVLKCLCRLLHVFL